MRILILDTLYGEFVNAVYSSHPGLEDRPSDEQCRVIYEYGFGRSDFLARNLRKLGHEASQILINVPALRRKIASELNLVPPSPGGEFRRLWQAANRRMRGVTPFSNAESNLLNAEVENFRPDVILNADVLHLPPGLVRSFRAKGILMVGECAYPIPPRMSLAAYDVMLSALPPYVDRFRAEGIRTLYWPHAFEASAVERIGKQEQTADVVFVGTVSRHHIRRLQLLEALAERVPLRIFGPTPHGLSKSSPLHGKFQAPLFGYQMLRELARAKVAFNVHAELAGNYAVNIRLFEATGAGTLLLTDFKENLGDFFSIGEEVAAFHGVDDCVSQVETYLANDALRQRVARAGQARTLADHSYGQRLKTLLAFLQEDA